jgi:hypothetical protein
MGNDVYLHTRNGSLLVTGWDRLNRHTRSKSFSLHCNHRDHKNASEPQLWRTPASRRYPCYYISGNDVSEYDALRQFTLNDHVSSGGWQNVSHDVHIVNGAAGSLRTAGFKWRNRDGYLLSWNFVSPTRNSFHCIFPRSSTHRHTYFFPPQVRDTAIPSFY